MKCSKCGAELHKSDVKGAGADWAKAIGGLAGATVATGGLGIIAGLAYAGKKVCDANLIRVKCSCCGKDNHLNKTDFQQLR